MTGKGSTRRPRQVFVYKCARRIHWTAGERSLAPAVLDHYEKVLVKACAATCGESR